MVGPHIPPRDGPDPTDRRRDSDRGARPPTHPAVRAAFRVHVRGRCDGVAIATAALSLGGHSRADP